MITFQNIKPRYSFIKKWPANYCSGVSISNDIEFTSSEVLELQMKYANTSDKTVLGNGIDLEMTNSLFFYSDSATISYFDGQAIDSQPTKYQPRLIEYLKSGHIDTNHGYGDFSFNQECTRKHIMRVYEELNNNNIKLEIYSNHGGEQNIQTIGEYKFRKGDEPSSNCYHLDLMRNHGVKWIWTEATMLENENPYKIELRKILSAYLKIKNPKRRFFSSKYIFAPYELEQNFKPYIFWRYRNTGTNAPNAETFLAQLKSINWQGMRKHQGGIIIYQHLGVLKRVNKVCTAMTVDKLISNRDLFVNPMHFLKDISNQYSVWVSGLSRFLNYIHMVSNIEINIKYFDDLIIYNIDTKGVDGYPIKNIEGLTLLVPAGKSIKIQYDEKNVCYQELGLVSEQKKIITIPFNRLANIW